MALTQSPSHSLIQRLPLSPHVIYTNNGVRHKPTPVAGLLFPGSAPGTVALLGCRVASEEGQKVYTHVLEAKKKRK